MNVKYNNISFQSAINFIALILLVMGGSDIVLAQDAMGRHPHAISPANYPMTSGLRNYKTFRDQKADLSPEVLAANIGFENHPEIGTLYEGAPKADCYEIIGKRTEFNKTFVKKGSYGKDIYVQTSNEPMHYKDASGNWRTIKSCLEPVKNTRGVYAATEQPTPVTIDANSTLVTLGRDENEIKFNNKLELIYAKPDGSEVSLGFANWANHTAGDQGVYVKDAWDGIDIEIFVVRGSVKTNFIVNYAMPQYADGQLLIRDHFEANKALHLDSKGQTVLKDNLEVRNDKNEVVYYISQATACEKMDMKNTLQGIEYHINQNTLDIALPGNFLNRAPSAYPVLIDPLISLATSSAVTNGSKYSATWTVPCVYLNAAAVPANVTVTDIQYAFTYETGGGAVLGDGAVDFKLGTCRSPTGAPGPAGIYWTCASVLPGTCAATGGAAYSIYADIAACVPAPQCSAYNMDITMDLYQDYFPTGGACSTTYIYGSTPLTITVFGHTVEIAPGGAASATPSTICLGSSSSLSATGIYGVPPYTYSWTPGPLSGTPVTVTPATTTAYNVTITDACGNTATSATTVTVDLISPITGTTTVCVGSTTLLADATGGAHTWTSSNPGVATITAGGLVTGVSAGTTTITFRSTATGCTATVIVTVNPNPVAIAGATTVCAGSTILLTDATAGGTWSSSTPGVATISATGTVTGVAAGTTTIGYTIGTCAVSTIITVVGISPITGTPTVCVGSTTALADATGGGTWSSSAPGVATVSATGVVTGVSAGTTTITYTTAAGCTATLLVTVSNIAAITGTTTVCAGNTTNLSDAGGAGTWSSVTPGVATISATGVVTGVAAGTSVISFTTAAGCWAITTVTVDDVAAIGGPTSVCAGSTINLTDATAGGTWSSSAPGVATVSATGVVTGVSAGTTTITYTSPSGCTTTLLITVNSVAAITGTLSVCVGGTTALGDATAGGTWSSGTPGVATISATGVVTGVSSGNSTIVYTTAAGCTASAIVTVNVVAPITGSTSVCLGSSIILSDATGGGTWSSSVPGVATISGTGVITTVSAGTTTIGYTAPSGCTLTELITVNNIAAITGTLSVCAGNTTALADAVAGGTWSSGTTGVATVSGTGVVTGVSGGNSTIVYTTAAGCTASAVVTVNTVAAITGSTSVCRGLTINLSDATAGGTWSSSAPGVATVSATGVVTGVTAGTTTITYTSPSGCTTTLLVTVDDIEPITGTTNVCVGNTTPLSDAAGAGSWSSSSTGVATISGAGVVTGVTAGTTTITFTTTTGGCTATAPVIVNSVAAITGTNTICTGLTVTLADATTGGTWSSSAPGIASVGATNGVVTGAGAGTATISYTSPAGCVSTMLFTVTTIPAITGTLFMCAGQSTTLADPLGAGTWSTGSTAIASVTASTGVVTGESAGSTPVTFTDPAGCAAFATITVNGIPAITGTLSVCAASMTALSSTIPGGAWSVSGSGIASINSSTGVLSGLAAGTISVTYTSPAGCTNEAIATVNPLPAAMTGEMSLCQGYSTTLSDATTGGSWSSSDPLTASIDAAGVVNAIAGGTVNLTYTTVFGCITAQPFTVNPTPPAISGSLSVCNGFSVSLSDGIPGGTWLSQNPAVASVDATSGVVVANEIGNVTITYTSIYGCYITTVVTVNAVPPSIAGIAAICVGASSQLSNTETGGTWSSSNPAIASVDVITGIVGGVAAGNATITFTDSGCIAIQIVTINPIPPAITGVNNLCINASETLSNTETGGVWSVSNGNIASVANPSGLLTAQANGVDTITYTVGSGCFTTSVVTVEAAPTVSFYVSPYICVGSTTTVALTTANPDIISYAWDFDSATVVSSSSNSFGPFYIKWTTPGTYFVTATGNSGVLCPSLSAQDTVLVRPYPDASIMPLIYVNSNPSICIGDSILFRANYNASYYNYIWSPMEFFNQNGKDVVYGIAKLAGYVTLQVTDPYGCTSTDSIYVDAQPCCNVYIPSAFTPNGDGLNDMFRPINLGRNALIDFRVVNRWGQVVYETATAGDIGWDGTFGGVPQDIGTYYYYLLYDCDGKQVTESGDVTLIR